MAKAWTPGLNEVPIDEALTLVVVSRNRQGLSAYVVDLQSSAEAAFREAAQATLDDLAAAEAVPFGPDVYLEADEYMAVPIAVVGAEHPVLGVLASAGSLDQLPADSIPRLWFYAVIVGDDPDSRVAFFRKTDPHIVAKSGRHLMTLGDALRVITRPVFVIDDRFDVVSLDGGLAVLHMTPFEILFRQADQMAERVEEWVEAITDHIKVEAEGLALLIESARGNVRLHRKLRSIYDRGHLAGVPVATIRETAKARGLDPDDLFDDEDTLMISDDTDLLSLLRLLNEDLFEGGLTGQEFAADRKRPVT